MASTTIHSKLGGLLRLRSYTLLAGAGLKRAAPANNPNPYFKTRHYPEARAAPNPEALSVRQVYEYDVNTQPGYLIRHSDRGKGFAARVELWYQQGSLAGTGFDQPVATPWHWY